MMQRAFGAVYRTTNRLAWLGRRSYSYESDGEFDSNSRPETTSSVQLYERSVNRVTLLGRVGKEPYFSTSSFKYANFPLATSIYYKQQGTDETKQTTTWHDVKVIKPLAVAKLHDIGTGSRLYIEGRLENRSSKGKDGKQQYRTSVVADLIIVLALKEKTEEHISFDTDRT
ncbi:single-stranded DNA-binding protein, mitochondrial-like [Mizuhopecten yessoensis]|uniref:Single-stranded DNA-binding protein, mitochondrial n=1 Tax=Mizuhopecten yessoensis TaxID=6573 RepID=A0A210QPN0_MIZYE|nr:single-stranded DNA-binding protein, mitochondrial-like [Mizuhopecten yessoensis]OWF50671.1 Single-stranded DNA-binding protein, mitochondrial [Mizuhopecten yessoensis]